MCEVDMVLREVRKSGHGIETSVKMIVKSVMQYSGETNFVW